MVSYLSELLQKGKCFDHKTRILTGPTINEYSMTIERCLEFCSTNGYSLYGLEHYGNCICGNAPPTIDPRPDSECDKPCHGDSNQICGGFNRINIFSVSP